MLTLVKQELFKLGKKKSTAIISAILLVFIFGVALLTKIYSSIFDPASMVQSGFGSIQLIIFILIASASVIIAMETQFGTIKDLLYRKYSRGAVLASKWLTILIYSIYLNVLIFVASIIAKLVLLPMVSLSDKIDNQTIVMSLITTLVGNFISTWLILSLVLLLASIFSSSGASIAAGIVFYFLTSILSGIQMLAIAKWDWIKWNPLNMMNLSNQWADGQEFEKLTQLTNNELIIGNLAYTALFLFLGYFVFKRKNV